MGLVQEYRSQIIGFNVEAANVWGIAVAIAIAKHIKNQVFRFLMKHLVNWGRD